MKTFDFESKLWLLKEKQGFFVVLTHRVCDDDCFFSLYFVLFFFKLLLFPYFTTESQRQTPTDRVIFTVFTSCFILRSLQAGGEAGSSWCGTLPPSYCGWKPSKVGFDFFKIWGLEVTQLELQYEAWGTGEGRESGDRKCPSVKWGRGGWGWVAVHKAQCLEGFFEIF